MAASRPAYGVASGADAARAPGAGWPALWLALAAAAYGGFGSPTPDAPGWPELLVGLCLVLAAGPMEASAAGAGRALGAARGPRWPAVAALAFACALWPALIRGAGLGWPPAAILRDVVPLAFLFLPVFLVRRLSGALGPDGAARLLAGVLALVGVLFAARYFAITGLDIGWLGRHAPSDGLLYLPNSPAVLFAATALPLLALERLARRPVAGLPAALALLVGGALCVAALAATLQRAALAMGALAAAACLLRRLRDRPAVALTAAVVAASVLALQGDWAGRLIDLLQWKHAAVGVNQHAAEIAVALEIAGRSPAHALFGAGWGALLETPAVPGYRVGYLHALPLYLLAKAGIVGLIAVAAYLLALAPGFGRLWTARPAVAAGAAAALAIGLAVQPSFKYLGFGLTLALVATAARR